MGTAGRFGYIGQTVMNAPLETGSLTAPPVRPLAPSLERRRVRLYLALVLIDAAVVLASFTLVAQLYLDPLDPRTRLLEGQLMLPLYLTLALYQRTYTIRSLQDWRFSAVQAVSALLLSAALLVFITFYAKSTAEFSRVVFTGGLALAGFLLGLSRRLLSLWIDRIWGASVTNLLVIEAGGPAVPLQHAIRIDAAEQNVWPCLCSKTDFL